jgi:hypothetical protein
LYAGFSSGVITIVDPDSLQSSFFHTLPGVVAQLAAAGDFVLAQASGNDNNLYVIDNSGEVVHSERFESLSEHALFVEESNRLIYTRFGSERISSARLDPSTGALDDFFTNYEVDGRTGERPMVAAPDSQSIVSAGGRQLTTTTLETISRPLRRPAEAVLWPGAVGLLSLESTEDGALLQRYADDFSVIDAVTYPGEALHLFQHNNQYYVFTRADSGLRVRRYNPSSDSDNDTVNNLSDAFPIDPAASVDVDGDGAPDAWNTGFSAADSTTGLILDAFPDDPACYRQDHGDGTQCDYATVIPDRVPDQLAMDNGGIVYMLYSDENQVYRRDLGNGRYIEPYYVGDSNPVNPRKPTLMSYSASLGRLFLAYPDGQVTTISPAASQTDELHFLQEQRPIFSMGTAGDYLFLASSDYSGREYKYYNSRGEFTDNRFWRRYGSEYTWDDAERRLYFISDGVSPSDLHYDQLTRNGIVDEEIESPYHGDYFLREPILLSPDGSRLYLGTSHFFDSESLERLGSLTREFTHGMFLPDGRLAVIIEESGSYKLAFYASDHTPLPDPAILSGAPFGLYYFENALHVFTYDEEIGVSVAVLVP